MLVHQSTMVSTTYRSSISCLAGLQVEGGIVEEIPYIWRSADSGRYRIQAHSLKTQIEDVDEGDAARANTIVR